MIFTSLSSLSAERCNISGHGTIFKANGEIFKDVQITDVKSLTREKNWKKCYEKAINMSKDYDSVIPVTISGGRVSGGSADTGLNVYMKWSFDDSSIPFMDTSGKITKYTDEYETYPDDGDLRYFSDGRLFE